MQINKNYFNLKDNHIFTTIAHKVQEFQKLNPTAEVIKLGIGDVTHPLCPSVIKAMNDAVCEMAKAETFRGYGPEQGYDFLKMAIKEYYRKNKVELSTEEIFISDGAKSDLGNILDIFAVENSILVPNPVYPIYVDSNIMAGRKIITLDANESNSFLPLPPENIAVDIIYLCSPSNPTGAVYSKEQLKRWVDYAIEQQAIILFDAAYEAFVSDENLPRSIFEIAGAEKCAIEFCSLSKTAGFTGLRCGYTIIPQQLIFDNTSLNSLWLRRQSSKFNGVPYIVQRAAEAVFSEVGQKETLATINYYKENAEIIADTLTELKCWFTGGKHSPYIWLKCPDDMTGWQYFDYLLQQLNIVGTPGSGFGTNGENFFRLTAFNSKENTLAAMNRLRIKRL